MGYVMLQVCRELERQTERAKLVAAHDGVDLEYLKNIMLKLYETGEAHCTLHTTLYPVSQLQQGMLRIPAEVHMLDAPLEHTAMIPSTPYYY